MFEMPPAIALMMLTMAQPSEKLPRFDVAMQKSGDSIQIEGVSERVAFVLRSPSGISRAAIRRTEKAWPKVVVVKLALRGLEHFDIELKQGSIRASVAWVEGTPHSPQQRGERDLPQDSPLRIVMRPLDAKGNPATAPNTVAWVEMTIPAPILAETGDTLKLHWIDFFRN